MQTLILLVILFAIFMVVFLCFSLAVLLIDTWLDGLIKNSVIKFIKRGDKHE